MTAVERGGGRRTYLRVGGEVFPVYGDELRGWSLRPGDVSGLTACSPYAYASLEELFFALVNLRVADPSIRPA
ncbi:MAG TPA: hypothetical protein VE911_00915 [Candidatus Nitrosopolaris sp.]|nr:hypothetical protein [Candidatus Nitrosopolaris sp.]